MRYFFSRFFYFVPLCAVTAIIDRRWLYRCLSMAVPWGDDGGIVGR